MMVPVAKKVARRMKWLNRNFGTTLVVAAAIAAATAMVPVSLCRALEPKEILVVANRNLAASVGLAKYYMTKRGIPEQNLLTLSVPNTEHIFVVATMKKT